MKRLPSLLLLLLTSLLLASCASTSALKFTPGPGGETVSIPAHRLAVTLPPDWRIAQQAPAGAVLFAAADNESLRFVLTGPLGGNDPGSKDALVANAVYQKGIQQALAEGGFTKVERTGMFSLAGVNAFRCEAATRSKSQSILQVHLPYRNRVWVFSFYSTRQHISKAASVPKILYSLQLAP
ncbi:hypothetical protein [Prosthecobacter sp.]|uniref:hypothetical protein n=1 Tax=Prosthecobacter sp. TaxID=1965333 RepID=UPI002ABC7563|nr:hypothetical protein [Prosthecobacter sp.]MDZ4403646.1 hypothetical protein [Prosthecobacter sp.]